MILSFKIRSKGCYGRFLNLPSYVLNFVSNEMRNIYILDLVYDEEMRSPLSNQGKCEKLKNLNKYFPISIQTKYLQFFSNANSDRDFYFIIKLYFLHLEPKLAQCRRLGSPNALQVDSTNFRPFGQVFILFFTFQVFQFLLQSSMVSLISTSMFIFGMPFVSLDHLYTLPFYVLKPFRCFTN